ncbi:MAG TPA: BON domain-containing protein [Steroidobacteraceae bacterium]|nr:BON domain-containing protein [Steroidobacteraceae bacterium]
MNAKKMLAVAAATIGLLGGSAVQADESKRSVGEYTDDKVLHTKVWAALTEDKTVESSEINLEVYKGVVQLNGFVDNEKEKTQAEAAAKAVSGVKGVENNLAIKQASQTTGGAIDDSTITAKVKSALIDSDETKAHDIKVATRGGVVQLSGFVATQAQKDAATKVAQSVKGVKSVENGISVKP